MVISHDRYFLDRISTHTLAFEDNGQVNFFLFGEIGERHRVGDVDVLDLVFKCGPGIAGRDVDFLQTRGLGQAPSQCMFASARADDE